MKFNFKNTVKIRVCTLKIIHEEKFIKFNCVKYFTRKMTGAIVTVQKDITTQKWNKERPIQMRKRGHS